MRGSENDLTILEQEWDKVQDQTLWTLENCYIMSPNANQSQNLDHTQAQVSQTSQSSETATLVADSPVVSDAPSDSTSSSFLGATAPVVVDTPSDQAFLDTMTTETSTQQQGNLPTN